MLSLLEALQNTGRFIINVRIVYFATTYKGDKHVAFLSMDFSKIWSRQLVNFMLGNVGMFRKIGFATLEQATNTNNCGSYGYACNIKNLIEDMKTNRHEHAVSMFGNEEDHLIIFDEVRGNSSKAAINDSVMEILKDISNGVKKVYCKI